MMREVQVSDLVKIKLAEFEFYLVDELKLSKEHAFTRVDRMQQFLHKLAGPADYALCRFRRWRARGWRCVPFEKNWMFAYETFPEGVIVRDMSHVAVLAEVN